MANRDRHMKTSSSFAPFLEPRNLRRMAGAVSFERGEDYFLNGQVKAWPNTRVRSRQRCKALARIGSSFGLMRGTTWNTRVLARWVRMVTFANIVWLWDSHGSRLDSRSLRDKVRRSRV